MIEVQGGLKIILEGCSFQAFTAQAGEGRITQLVWRDDRSGISFVIPYDQLGLAGLVRQLRMLADPPKVVGGDG